jgi:hypothetical protein
MRLIYIAFASISLFTLIEVVAENPPQSFPIFTRSEVFAREKESTSPDALLSWPFDLSVGSLNRAVAEDEFDENQPHPNSTPTAPSTPLPPTATPSITAATSRSQPNVALNPAYSQASPLPLTGLAMYYNPNVMNEVVANRMAMGHLSTCGECIGHVALLRVGDLNRRVWLQWADGKVEGPFLVADVAAAHHVGYLLERNWVVDVDYQTALRRGMNGPVAVTVLAGPSASAPPVVDAGAPANPPVAADHISVETPIATATMIPTEIPLQYAISPPSITSQSLSGATPTPVHLALHATSAPTAFPFPYDLDDDLDGAMQPQAVEPSVTNQLGSDMNPSPTAYSMPATATPIFPPTATVQPAQPTAVTKWVPHNAEPTPTMVVLIDGMTKTPTPLPYPYEK